MHTFIVTAMPILIIQKVPLKTWFREKSLVLNMSSTIAAQAHPYRVSHLTATI
jgi:hypothetical protein